MAPSSPAVAARPAEGDLNIVGQVAYEADALALQLKCGEGKAAGTVGAAVECGGWNTNALNAGGGAGGDGCEEEEEEDGWEGGDGGMHFEFWG